MQRWIFEHHLLQQKLPEYTAWTVASIWEGNKVSAVFILGKEDWSFQHKLKFVHLEDWCEPVLLLEEDLITCIKSISSSPPPQSPVPLLTI